MIEPLDQLAYEFFREFARCEYCLKAVGLTDPNRRDPTADWGRFAAEVQELFTLTPSLEFREAVQFYLENPPRKQVFQGLRLDWSDTLPDHHSQSELVLRLICRVRNNLFHGGKFNGHWFEPQRSDALLRHGLEVMRSVVDFHPAVRQAYRDKAA